MTNSQSPLLGVLAGIELPIIVRFGRTVLPLHEILSLQEGSTVEFDRAPDEPVDILVNGRVVARGEAVMVAGNYGIRVSEITAAAYEIETITGGRGR